MKTVVPSSVEQSELPMKRQSDKKRLERLLKEMLLSGTRLTPQQISRNPQALYRRIIE